ncbi:MAG TPA: biotin/lipoyl-containing protein, partial [Steroidobacteraceae bacterium]
MSTLLDVLSPANEEGTRATVLRWCRKVGECVAENEPLVELETDKVTVEVPAPATGELVEILRNENDAVEAGTLLARLRIAAAPTAAASAPLSPTGAAVHGARPAPASRALLSPAVRRLLGEHRLSATQITGSGRDGRITAQDVIRHAGALAPAAQALHKLVAAARAGKLVPAEVRGGTFTISNHGVSGSILAAPVIINQPQVAIL